MQEIKIYVSAAEAVGVLRDNVNARNVTAPSLVRGVETALRIRLFSDAGSRTPYPIESFSAIAAWQFVMDRDYDENTNFILQADDENIRAQTTTDIVNDIEQEFTEIYVPISNMNTVELDEYLGTGKSQSGLTAELVGYNAEGDAVFVLQIENFSIRNRLTGSGEPTELDPEYLTAVQVRALIAGVFQNPIEYQFSVDGENDWHESQTDDDHYFRQRIANLDAEWSNAVMMVKGEKGDTGEQGVQGEKGEKGDTGEPGAAGADGHTPERGTDYWTEDDKAEIKAYVDEVILNGEW